MFKSPMRFVTAVTLLACIFMSIQAWTYASSRPLTPAAVEDEIAVFFSPDGGFEDVVVASLDAARKQIKMQAFILSNNDITNALIRAAKRGVNVEVIFDHEWTGQKISDHADAGRGGVNVYVGPKGTTMHNKVILIDGSLIITGSANFSVGAEERNFENTLVMRNKPKIYRAYEANHNKLRSLSERRTYKQN